MDTVVTPIDERQEFPGQEPRERVLMHFRQHWIRLARHSLVLLGWLIALGIGFALVTQFSGPTTRRMFIVAIALLFALVQLRFMMEIYRHYLHLVIITDRKIHRIKKTFLTVDDHVSVSISSLQDIRRQQRGIVQNLLGFGSLVLEAYDSTVRIHFVPNVREKHHVILSIREPDHGIARAASKTAVRDL